MRGPGGRRVCLARRKGWRIHQVWTRVGYLGHAALAGAVIALLAAR